MALDYESLGGGAGAGILGSILAVFGFHRRLTRLEDCKQNKAVCESIHEVMDKRLETLQNSIDHLTTRIDFLINSRRD
jgi:hypothetical protein